MSCIILEVAILKKDIDLVCCNSHILKQVRVAIQILNVTEIGVTDVHEIMNGSFTIILLLTHLKNWNAVSILKIVESTMWNLDITNVHLLSLKYYYFIDIDQEEIEVYNGEVAIFWIAQINSIIS